MTNLIEQCQKIDAVRKELIRTFSFFIEDGLFEQFTISEDLRNLGMGFKVLLITEELVIGIYVSNLEKSIDCKMCLRQQNVSIDWSLLKSEFDVFRYLGLVDSSFLNDVENTNELIRKIGLKIKEEVQSIGIVGFLSELEQL
ncbi:hypothetical protein L1D50_21930 [Pseudoalteromonas sp. Isolate6]|uniref:hypothetical protein n=1 Tax=Pseudoalteromonas sp. Isolate6 TaxID=2908527 RepID=UPI001EFDE225|nr:hypothetical protein [Pseudoalteromonas sp. Isolate6]MCG9761720.1 hypothetical protein [Pseudoalteromonas sp. Isolate6]